MLSRLWRNNRRGRYGSRGRVPPPRCRKAEGGALKYNSDIHHRRSTRLRNYDYSTVGAYFVTICTFERECLFGEVVNGEMRLNETGCIVDESWQQIVSHFTGVDIDQHIIMPNHFHGIITTVGRGSPALIPGGRKNRAGRPRPYDGRHWGRLSVISNINPPNASTNYATIPVCRCGSAIITNG